MNRDAEFLNYVYQNTQMGIETMEQLINIVEEPEFFKQLRSQLNEYEKINKEAEKMLKESGNTEEDVGKLEKITAYMSIGLKTLTDRSTRHIAEMLMEGTNKGIIDVTKRMSEYSDIEESVKNLADKLLKTEQNNMEALKNYL